MTFPPRTAFTLIELLVVVTIIVVLIALLTPALDQAIYQAQLVQCSAKLHGIAGGVQVYAMENQRAYPTRPWLEQGIGERPVALNWVTETMDNYDGRPLLRPYMDLDAALICPLVAPVHLEAPQADADSTNLATYGLWFGFRYQGFSGLRRLGDRLASPYGDNESFDVLAGDWDAAYINDPYDYASHPDKDNRMVNHPYINTYSLAVVYKTNYSFWEMYETKPRRGMIDTNYAFTDGSVLRYSNVPFIALAVNGPKQDKRMANLPARYDGDNVLPAWRCQIPRR